MASSVVALTSGLNGRYTLSTLRSFGLDIMVFDQTERVMHKTSNKILKNVNSVSRQDSFRT